MNLENIQIEAKKCLECKMKPCSKACPMSTNIPEFIKEIKENNFEKAYNILIENNVFSHVCSLVCPQENQCQGSCVRGIKGTPTQIGKLEEFVNIWAETNNIKPNINVLKEKPKRVAIIGSGPAGLSCAYELIKQGVKSTVFEKEEVLGGILAYGIPDFRLDKKIITNIVNMLKELGVEFKTKMELGKNIDIKTLKQEYDFVFIGIGAELSSTYKLSDEKLEKIYDSDEFLKSYNYNKFIPNLGEVVVIGGGNVAMDVARAAKHMGATKVSILYRRDRNHMPARKIELDECLKEKIEFKELVRVISANSKNQKLMSVHCINTKIVDEKAVDDEGEFDYKADTVVFAIGLKPNKDLLIKQGIELTDWGSIKVNEYNETCFTNVYAGGDVVDNKSVVCKALASGKKAAKGMLSKIEDGLTF